MSYQIFIIQRGVVRPTAEILTVYPFDEIWKRDKTETKERAMNDFAFIEFMISPMKTNIYKDEKHEKKFVRLKEKYLKGKNPDKLMNNAMDLYEKAFADGSVYYQLLKSAKKAVWGLRDFLETAKAKLDERTKSGGMVIKPADITRALNDIPNVVKNVKDLENKMHDEIEDVRRRANKVIGHFEHKPESWKKDD